MLFKSLLIASGLSYAAAATTASTRTCASDNTGSSFSAVTNIYNSPGSCEKTCGSSYTYGILKDNRCWCSNSAPSSTVDSSKCDEACPGYPQDSCGSKDNDYYTYFEITDEDAIIGANQTAAYTGSVTWTGSVSATASSTASTLTTSSNATITSAPSSSNGTVSGTSGKGSSTGTASPSSYTGAANKANAAGMGLTGMILGAAALIL